MTHVDNEGFILDKKTGARKRHYICDPDKNTACNKKGCIHKCEDGYCDNTTNAKYRKDGTMPFAIKIVKTDRVIYERAYF